MSAQRCLAPLGRWALQGLLRWQHSTAAAAASSAAAGPAGAAGAAAAAPLQLCVVGSGPAGCYVTSQLLKRFGAGVAVALLDRLPTPFGLVRSGVAPDHQKTKNVTHQFQEVCGAPQVSFFGNATVGRDVTLAQLRALFHGVVLAYGAESDRRLHIPGEGLGGVLSAREFVWWYNGHPDHTHLPVDLSRVRAVAVLGVGNVALDCARVLLQPPARLAASDVAGHALGALRRSAVRSVHLVGRRGAAQASFTAKELRELLRLEGVRVVVHPPGVAGPLSAADAAELAASRVHKRVHGLLLEAYEAQHWLDPPGEPPGAATGPGGRPDMAESERPGDSERELHLHFLRSPLELRPGPQGDRVAAVRLGATELVADLRGAGHPQRAVPTGETEELQAELVLESIGYKSLPLEGAPFDARSGTIPHRVGRVLRAGSLEEVEPGLYCCGWVKRGPTGVIGTNLHDALQTVNAVAEDALGWHDGGRPRGGVRALQEHFREHHLQVVNFQGWERIDRAELEAGARLGKPRDKFVDVAEMLAVAGCEG